jgi:hypothetical protein
MVIKLAAIFYNNITASMISTFFDYSIYSDGTKSQIHAKSYDLSRIRDANSWEFARFHANSVIFFRFTHDSRLFFTKIIFH